MTRNSDPQEMKNPFQTSYPRVPVKELEEGRTSMDSHGGYWDYFSIFKKREEAWLKKQKEVLGQNYWF